MREYKYHDSKKSNKPIKITPDKNLNIPVTGELVRCRACKRPILIERGLLGTDHTLKVIATCWECLTMEEKRKASKLYKLEKI